MLREATTTTSTNAATRHDVLRNLLQYVTLGGVLALAATTFVLLLANSGLAPRYYALWDMEIRVTAGTLEISRPLLAWINDGLLTLLFFVGGLELKRQWMAEQATTSTLRLALAAALGGGAASAALYAVFNLHSPGNQGWTIPLATDAALALALIALPGLRIPFVLRSFFLTVALTTHVLAAAMLMLREVGTIHRGGLGVALGLVAVLLLANEWGIRRSSTYLVGGVLAWLAVFGTHMPTSLLGIVVAWTIPARPAPSIERLLHEMRGPLAQLTNNTGETSHTAIQTLYAATRNVQPLVYRIARTLHPWVWLVIVPIFAFANAGIPLLIEESVGGGGRVAAGISAALIIGKPLGVVGACWLAVRLGVAALPPGMRWAHLWGVGFLAGGSFTVALFAATTAFSDPALLNLAKLNVLRASFVAVGTGLIILTCASISDDQRAAEVDHGEDV